MTHPNSTSLKIETFNRRVEENDETNEIERGKNLFFERRKGEELKLGCMLFSSSITTTAA